MLNHIYVSFVFFGLWVGSECVALGLEALHDTLPLLFLADQGGREVDLVGVVDAFCLGDCFVDLELCYGVREGEDLLQVQVFLAKFGVSKLFEVFHEIDLILQFNHHDFIPQGLDQPKRDQHRRDFLLRDDEIPDPLGKLQGEIIEEKADFFKGKRYNSPQNLKCSLCESEQTSRKGDFEVRFFRTF